MARDYSSRTAANKGKKKGRCRPAAKPQKNGPPGWVWLVSGLCIGLVIAAAVYVFGRPAGSPGISIEIAGLPGAQKPVAEDKQEELPESKPKEKPRFAFYDMLPNYEVVIPEEEYVEPSSQGQTSKKSQSTRPTVQEPGRYVIQAGSFSKFEDADRRKAGLALLGVESEIEKVTISGGRTVYRVRTAPADNLDQVNKTLKRLREEGIDTLVMRYKG